MHSFIIITTKVTSPLPDALLSCFLDIEDVIDECFVLFKCFEAKDFQMSNLSSFYERKNIGTDFN